MQIEIDLPNIPLDVYVSNNILHVKQASKHSTVRQTKDSLLLLSILKLAQYNLQHEIKQEGFIVVEPDIIEDIKSMQQALPDDDLQRNDDKLRDSPPNFAESFLPREPGNRKTVNLGSPYLEQELHVKDRTSTWDVPNGIPAQSDSIDIDILDLLPNMDGIDSKVEVFDDFPRTHSFLDVFNGILSNILDTDVAGPTYA